MVGIQYEVCYTFYGIMVINDDNKVHFIMCINDINNIINDMSDVINGIMYIPLVIFPRHLHCGNTQLFNCFTV